MGITDYRVTVDQGDGLREHTRAVIASEPNAVPDVAIGLERWCRAPAEELVVIDPGRRILGVSDDSMGRETDSSPIHPRLSPSSRVTTEGNRQS